MKIFNNINTKKIKLNAKQIILLNIAIIPNLLFGISLIARFIDNCINNNCNILLLLFGIVTLLISIGLYKKNIVCFFLFYFQLLTITFAFGTIIVFALFDSPMMILSSWFLFFLFFISAYYSIAFFNFIIKRIYYKFIYRG